MVAAALASDRNILFALFLFSISLNESQKSAEVSEVFRFGFWKRTENGKGNKGERGYYGTFGIFLFLLHGPEKVVYDHFAQVQF